MKRGNIVLIKYPCTDLSSSKVRPALIISSDAFTNSSEDAIFAFISSRTDNRQSTDFLLNQSHPEFLKSGLRKSSLIKTGKIASLSKSLASRLLGEVSPEIMREINKSLKQVLNLN